RGLLRFDPALVHTLDAAGPGIQRRVAVRAAHRACEAAGLTDVPWIVRALTALTEGRPLPSPFDDHTTMFDALRADPGIPSRTVLEAMPPQRPPYKPPQPHPDQPRPAPRPGDSPRPATRQGLGRYLGTLTPTPPAKEQFLAAYAEIRPAGEPRPPHRISQPHYALPAIPAAADPDPLRAA
ncbi:hypothetical protein NGM37_53970, partial [Streptomyces sp. TRM76130]|nr:hypothetical protein [Streptomyces sp. TRM76130]